MTEHVMEHESRAITKHPPVNSVEEVITFRLAQLVSINERAGHRWSEVMFDISLNEWRLVALVQSHKFISAGHLAELLLMDKSQLSRLIKSLQQKSLLRSKTDKEDARAVMLSLSPKGERLYDKMIAEVLRRNEGVLKPLSANEAVLLNDLLGRLIDHNTALLQAPPLLPDNLDRKP